MSKILCYKFCVYLTIYSGNLLPPFYIGYVSVNKIFKENNPYHGSVGSKKYGKTWKQELKENPHLFRTIILKSFFTSEEAIQYELYVQKFFKVAKNPMYINMSYATGQYCGAPPGKDHWNYGGTISETHRKAISIANSGENHWNYGNKCNIIVSGATRRKLSVANSGENNPMYGKSIEWTDEMKQKQSEKFSGIGNPNYGNPSNYKWSEELKVQHSEKLKGNQNAKGYIWTDEQREKHSNISKGGNNPAAKEVIVNGIIYGCKKECKKLLNITSWQLEVYLETGILIDKCKNTQPHPIIIDGIQYKSKREAMKILNIERGKLEIKFIEILIIYCIPKCFHYFSQFFGNIFCICSFKYRCYLITNISYC